MELQLSIQKENPSIDTTPVANNREVSLSVAKQTIVTRNEEVVSEEVIDIIFARLSKGEPGKSAYQAAVEAGYTLSEAEFNRDLATISELAGAVDDKVDKEEFNTLKEDVENFTAEYNEQLDNLEQALDGKVDKVDGKQLSTEDFTTEYKEQLDTLIENGGNGSDGELRELFNLMFEYDESLNAIQAKLPLYSLGSITAKGKGTSSGGGGGGTAYDRLDSWADYTTDKAGYVLSAGLGNNLNTRLTSVERAGYITSSALEGYATETFVSENFAPIEIKRTIDDILEFKTTFEKMFSLDTDDVIKAKLPLYSLGSITAKGKGTSSGGGGGGTAYDRLDSWADYTTDKAGYVLSAGLGWDLNTRISNKFDSANFTKANLKSTLGISDWALAATKPSYTAAEVGALSLDGGTINGDTILNGNVKIGKEGNATVIFRPNNTASHWFGVNTDGVLFFTNNGYTATYTILHSGNLGGYKLSQFTDDVVAGKYLPLSGGTMTGDVYLGSAPSLDDPCLRKNISFIFTTGWARTLAALAVDSKLKFHIGGYGTYYAGASDNELKGYAYIGCNNYDGLNLRITPSSIKWGDYDVIHSGNIGNYKSGDSANLGGKSKDYYIGQNTDVSQVIDINAIERNHIIHGNKWSHNLSSTIASVLDISYSADWRSQLLFNSNTKRIYSRFFTEGYLWSDWQQIAFITDNVASATKLQTPRSLWGNDFDGTGDIWGSIHLGQHDLNVSDDTSTYRAMRLYPNYGFYIGSGTSGNYDTLLWGKNIQFVSANGLTRMCVQSDGKVGIGTNSPNVLLTVNGELRAADSIYLHNTNEINSFQDKLYLNHHGSGLAGYGSTNDIVMVANGGNVSIGKVYAGSTAKLQIDTTATTNWAGVAEFLSDSLTDTHIQIGRSLSTKNSAFLAYHHTSANSNLNYTGIGFYGGGYLVKIFADGSIEIGGVKITASNGSITVNGNVLATGSITAKISA